MTLFDLAVPVTLEFDERNVSQIFVRIKIVCKDINKIVNSFLQL